MTETVTLVPRDRAALLRRQKLRRDLRRRRLWQTLALQGSTHATYLWATIEELRVLNSRLDALGARSRPLRGLAVTGEVT